MANRNYPKNVTATTVIPFDNPVTYIPPKTVTGATTFTKTTAGAQAGYCSIIRVIADGSHTPDLSAFKLIGTGTWDNTSGAVNQLWFVFDGTDYCVSITHPAVISGGGGGGDTTPPTMVSATLIDSTHVTVVFSEAMGSVTVTGWSFYDSTTLTTMGFDTVTGSGTAWTFHITSGTGVSGDTYTISYAPSTGNTTDTSSNELGVINNASVTNGIGGSGSFATANRLDLWKESGFTVAGGLVTQWDPVGSSGIVFVPSAGEEPAYDSTDDAVVSTGSESLKYTAGFDLAASFSCYFLIKLTGYPSELLSPGNGYVIYMDATSMIVRPSITGGGSPNYQTNTSHISTMSTYKVLTVVVTGGSTPSVVYLDGVAVGSFDSSTLSDSRTMEGIFGELGSRLKGKLKRMAIFNVAHDASTVATNSPLLATA